MNVARTLPGRCSASLRTWAAALAILAAAACGGGGGSDTKQPAPTPPPALAITRVEPSQASRDGKIKLTGPGLGGATEVLFGAWKAHFRPLDATSLEATVPYFATTGKLTVRGPGSVAVSTEDFRVLPPGVEAPVLDSIAPLQGAPGLEVTLMGKGLGEPQKVTFGGVEAARPTAATATLLKVKVPPHARTGPVAVTTAEGTATSKDTFRVLAEGVEVPLVRSVLPLKGAVGEKVTIYGEGLQHHTRIAFAGTPAAPPRVEAGLLETQVPAGAVTGPLTLANAAGDVVQAGTFTVLAAAVPVRVDTFEPETGPPGTRVVVKGPGVGKAAKVRLGALDCFHFAWGEDYLAVHVPEARHDPVTAPLTLIFADGRSVATPRSFRITLQAPVVDGFSPRSGPAGLAVTVRGKHLDKIQGVWFGDVKADAIAKATPGSFVVAVPEGAATGPIKVTTPGGTAESRVSFQVLAPGAGSQLFVSKAYLTQGSQDLDGSVPLVAGRPGYFRAFVLTSDHGAAAPSLRVTIRDAHGTSVLSHVIPPPLALAPMEIREGSLAESWNLPIPGDALKPGNTLLAEVEGGGATFPEDGRPLALDVREVPPLEVTLVPIRSGGRVGRVTGGGRTLDDWASFLKAAFPLEKVVVREAPPFTAPKVLAGSGAAYVDLLVELEVARQMDPRERWRYRAGVFEFPHGGDTEGRAMTVDNRKGSSKYRSVILFDSDQKYRGGPGFADTLGHELGHALGRRHAPCGGAGGPDPAFPPYPKACIGVLGFDLARRRLVDPEANFDIMGYCYPRWTSDYTYKAILDFRSGDPMPADAASLQMAPQVQDCLLVWGRLEDGKLTLEPAFQCRREPDPPEPGDYRLVLRDAHGAILQEVPFEAPVVPDGPPPHEFRTFTFVLPKPRGLASLEVVHDGRVLGAIQSHAASALAQHRPPVARPWGPGKVHVSWDYGAHPCVVVKDPAGQVLAVASGGSVEVATTAKELALTMSDGLETEVVKVPVGE